MYIQMEHKDAYRADTKMNYSNLKSNLFFLVTFVILIVNDLSQCQKIEQATGTITNTISKHKTNNNQSQYHHHKNIRQELLVAETNELSSPIVQARDDSLPIINVATDTQDYSNQVGNKPVTNDNNSDEQNDDKKHKIATSSSSFSSSILRSYNRVNHMRSYHLDLHSYRQDALYSGDPSFISSNNLHHLQRCRRHLNHFYSLIKSFKESDPLNYENSFDSIRLADTLGKPESGLLLGNQFWLGSYESCLDLKLSNPFHNDMGFVQSVKHGSKNSFVLFNESTSLDTQYCLGLTQFPDWNSQDTKLTIRVGLCLPNTCTSSMLNTNSDLIQIVESMILMNNFGRPFDKLKLRSIYCLPHETSDARKLSTSATIFAALVGTLFFITSISTIYDYFDRRIPDELKLIQQQSHNHNWRQIVVGSFSLIRNYEKFVHLTHSNDSTAVANQIDEDGEPICRFNRTIFFNSIAGIKCIGLLWIIAAHTLLVTPIPARNLIVMDKITDTYLANLYLTAHLMVDTFFTISGILAAYLIFRGDITKLTSKHWITMTIHRYWRLTPVYLMTYWYSKSIGQLMGTGPLWDYGTAAQSPRLQCSKESWLVALLHLSDFKSPKEHCVPFAWFTANNFKFWLVTPFFLLMIAKSTRLGYKITIGTIAANILLVFVLAMSSSVDMKSVLEFKPESADNMLNTMGQVYTRPYSRIGAYLIGLLVGHIFYRIDAGQLEIKISKNTKIIMWTICSATIMVLTFMFKLAGGVKIEDSAIPWIFSISSSLIRPLWALITCWFIYALSIGHARGAAKFLTANIWRYLVKLSFCAYLLQGEVIASMYLNQTHSGVFTYGDIVINPIVNIVITILVSFLVLLLVEYPMVGIEELILPTKRAENKTTLNQHSSSSKKHDSSTFTDNHSTNPLSQNEKLKCS